MTSSPQKHSVDQIRQHFEEPDQVERFSNLDIGQTTTMDAPLVLELIASTAARVCPQARSLLDIGCGAGNYTLKLLQFLPNLDVTLVDLSRPMLDRAIERVRPVARGALHTMQGDIRELELAPESFDIITAAAVFHHLREDGEWESVFEACHRALRPGGCLWISDLTFQENPAVQERIWERYGEYLVQFKGPEFRDYVFDYIDKEDSPRPLTYQLELLRRVGFTDLDVLHKNGPFATFGGMKRGSLG